MAITRSDLPDLVYNVLDELGGKASVLEVSRLFWGKHHEELKVSSDDIFYQWQYMIRWAAQDLRDNGRFKEIPKNENGKPKRNQPWEIAK